MERKDQSMCECKVYQNKVVNVLEDLGGEAVTVDLLELLRDHHGVPVADAIIALMDAENEGVIWDRVEHQVRLKRTIN